MKIKNFLIPSIVLLLSTTNAFSQIGIGNNAPHAESLLDFGSELRGIVLSPVPDVTLTTPTAGTIAFDGATGSFRTYNGTWSTPISGGVTGSSNTTADTNTQGVIIGAATSTAEGALILEATGDRKTLILPKVNHVVLTIKNPSAGMIIYDSATDEVKVFNGNVWVNL